MNTSAEAQQSSSPVSIGHALVDGVKQRLRGHHLGHEEIIELALAAFLGGGHLLLEGPPGTGKTSLAKAMAGAFGGSFRRVQLTSDLLPSDVVGILRLKPGSGDFEFRHGPIFTNFLLADELNRTSPKTQSALLEAMGEGTITVDGKSHPLPRPFFVVATQNPLEFHGVYPLAESQLDRFMLQLHLGTPEKADELRIYRGANPVRNVSAGSNDLGGHEVPGPLLSIERTQDILKEVQQVHVEDSILEYALDLVRATRFSPGVAFGVSVRGGLQLVAAAKALAYLRGRDFATPKDISALAVPALAHRLCFLGGEPDAQKRKAVIQEILERVRAPK